MPKKRLLLSALLAIFTAAPALGMPVSITVRNVPVHATAMVYRGHVFLPLRVTFETLNSTVWYDAQTRVITARNILHTLQLRVNDRNAVLDAHPVVLEASPRMVNGSVFVPVAFAAEAMGAVIRFDPVTHVLAVNGTPPGSRVVAQTPPRTDDPAPPPDATQQIAYPNGYYAGGYAGGVSTFTNTLRNRESIPYYGMNHHAYIPNPCLPALAPNGLFLTGNPLFLTGNPLFPIGQYGSALPVFMPLFFPNFNHFGHHFGPR